MEAGSPRAGPRESGISVRLVMPHFTDKETELDLPDVPLKKEETM